MFLGILIHWEFRELSHVVLILAYEFASRFANGEVKFWIHSYSEVKTTGKVEEGFFQNSYTAGHISLSIIVSH